MVTLYQIKKIHTLKSRLGLDDELYRDMLMSFGVGSSKNLTNAEAQVFIEILEDKFAAFKKQIKKYDELSSRGSLMASPAQLRMLEAVWREICFVDSDDFAKQSLRKYLQNKFGVSDLKFLTKNKAVKAIRSIINIKSNVKGKPALV